MSMLEGTMNLAKLHGVVRKADGGGVQCTVTVYPAGSVNEDGTLIGSPEAATLYSDQNGETTTTNPITTEASGQFSCYAWPGSYDLRFAGESITARGVRDVQLPAGLSPNQETALAGAVTWRGKAVAVSAANYGTGAADWESGVTYLFTHPASMVISLPAINDFPAGAWFRCVNIGTDATSPLYAAHTEGGLLGPNNEAANSVSFASGQRIGSSVLFLSTGSQWVAINENAGCEMTVSG